MMDIKLPIYFRRDNKGEVIFNKLKILYIVNYPNIKTKNIVMMHI